jgi:N-acetylmuramoyl-L-alanine amidase
MWTPWLALVATLGISIPTAPAGPVPLTEQTFIVAVDAGHGGSNEGCLAFDHTSHEKEFTRALALDLRRELEDRLPGVEIVLTRESDESVSLAQRVAAANEAGAHVFVSLHANASPDHTQMGFETYVLDARASNLEAARTARRENDEGLLAPSSTDGIPEVATMLRQLEMAAHRAAAVRFASAIQRRQAERFPQRVDRGVKQAPFDVLMGARMPAVLFEAGFLDHGTEGPLLLDSDRRRPIAEGLAEAIVDQVREQRRSS